MIEAPTSKLTPSGSGHRRPASTTISSAIAPLPVLASCEGYTYSANGFAIRVMTFGNGQSDTESTRIDVLYGIQAVRGIHACRIIQ